MPSKNNWAYKTQAIRARKANDLCVASRHYSHILAQKYFIVMNCTGRHFFKNSQNSEAYLNCQLSWNNNSDMKREVYNREFVEENFHQSTSIKGIFTLGKESHEVKETIAKNQRNSIR